ncbi:MAG: NAD+ synthase [Parachlamydiaceae bacterium]
MKVLVAQINPTTGDLTGNTAKIISVIQQARQNHINLVLFPELALTGYTPQDFLLLPFFIDSVEACLNQIIGASQGTVVVVGTPRRNLTGQGKGLFNSAAIIQDGVLLGFQDKMLLPTYDVFDERRYFEAATDMHIWTIKGKRIGVTICEDLWQHSAFVKSTRYQRDPVLELKPLKPDFVVNLSASPFSLNKGDYRFIVCKKAATTLDCPVILCNQVGGNDSLIYDGHSLVVAKDGTLMMRGKGFDEDLLIVDLDSEAKDSSVVDDPMGLLYRALVLGIRDYFAKSGFSQACLGLSGGIDSAVVACLAVEALGAKNVIGVGLPSRYSSAGSLTDAATLAATLGIKFLKIPIEAPFQSCLETLEAAFEGLPADITEENLQARIRGMILMALSNKHGWITLNTGNKSELAMGYCTLYGDMCGGLGVINDLSKRQVYALAQWINRSKEIIPVSTLQKPPSAELRPNQFDSDSLPEYDIVDNVVEAYVEHQFSKEEIAEKFGYPVAIVENLIKKIHQNEYKRRQSAPGLRVSDKAFSAGRSFPIVQGFIR